MTRLFKYSRVFLICTFFISSGLIGCSPKPSNEDIGKLEQARVAAESAEKKLHELRQERMQLESELQGKQGELQATEKENADISQ
jgi:Skp family chaperone for outer membrane proteins